MTLASHVPGSPLEGRLLAQYEAQGQCPLSLPAAAKAGRTVSGAPGIENAAVERRRADRSIARPVRALRKGHATLEFAPRGAPLPLYEGANRKTRLTLARNFRSENGGACPGEVGTGSPSGHATKQETDVAV